MDSLIIAIACIFILLSFYYFRGSKRKKPSKPTLTESRSYSDASHLPKSIKQKNGPPLPVEIDKDNKVSEKPKFLKDSLCPNSCSNCFEVKEEVNIDYYINPDWDIDLPATAYGIFNFQLADNELFAVFDYKKSKKSFHFINQTKKLTSGPYPAKAELIYDKALIFKDNEQQKRILFFFRDIFKDSIYKYGILFLLSPESVEKISEYFYIPPLALPTLYGDEPYSLSQLEIVGLCQKDKEVSLIINFQRDKIKGVFRILPGKRKYPVILEKVGSSEGKLLPKVLHLPFLEIILFGRSPALGTTSLGKAFEILYLKGKVPKSYLKSILEFFIKSPELPELDYFLKLYTRFGILNKKVLLSYVSSIIESDKYPHNVKAFCYRLLAEFNYEQGNFADAEKFAKKALELNPEVGVKRLLKKLEKESSANSFSQ